MAALLYAPTRAVQFKDDGRLFERLSKWSSVASSTQANALFGHADARCASR
jgi:hypothetical protein